MKTTKIVFATALLSIMLFASCKKDKEPTVETSTVELKINNIADSKSIVFETGRYLNPNKDTFSIVNLKYIMSNIKLYREGKVVYTETNSYHLVDENLDESKTILLNDVPAGLYDKIEIAIGVDEANDNNTAKSGDLGTNNGLFWASWGSYIYYRLDGMYHNDTSITIAFHAGGKSAYSVYELDLLLNPLTTTNGKTSSIYLDAEVNALFDSPNKIDFSKLRNIAAQGTTMDSLGANLNTNLMSVKKVINP